MSLALHAIGVAADDREPVVRAARATRDRDSLIGRYSIDEDGHTTTGACGRLVVVDGKLAWDLPLAGSAGGVRKRLRRSRR